jgi:hypothetical protein
VRLAALSPPPPLRARLPSIANQTILPIAAAAARATALVLVVALCLRRRQRQQRQQRQRQSQPHPQHHRSRGHSRFDRGELPPHCASRHRPSTHFRALAPRSRSRRPIGWRAISLRSTAAPFCRRCRCLCLSRPGPRLPRMPRLPSPPCLPLRRRRRYRRRPPLLCACRTELNRCSRLTS